MSPWRAVYGSVFISLLVLGAVLVAGNFGGSAAAQPPPAPAAAPAQEVQTPAGEVTGTAVPGDQVIVTQGQTLIGETVAGADGTWRVPIPKVAATTTPYHVRIIPSQKRGGIDIQVDGPVSLTVSVVVGASKVEVRVQVTSSNGRIEVDILAPVSCPGQPVTPPQPDPNSQAQPTTQPAAETPAQSNVTTQPEATPQPAAGPAYHQVKSGETLAAIAARYGVTQQAIVQANKLRNANLIYVGQKLVIPGK